MSEVNLDRVINEIESDMQEIMDNHSMSFNGNDDLEKFKMAFAIKGLAKKVQELEEEGIRGD